jgi:hypothetical protein
MRTLVTDDFADDGWLDADDQALLRHMVHGIVTKAVTKALAASQQPSMPEPADMTVLFVKDCPGDFPRVWVRNDRKSQIFVTWSSGRCWQREGDDGWFDWDDVLKVTKAYTVVTVVSEGEAG